jgi:cellulose synthase (UDP-forming)
MDYGADKLEYYEILYDRVPSLPQNLARDAGIISHMWQNIAHRVVRTTRY